MFVVVTVLEHAVTIFNKILRLYCLRCAENPYKIWLSLDVEIV